MNATTAAVVTFACLIAAISLGMRLHRMLPAHQRSADSVVVCWLVVLFLSFSLIAPPNATTAAALIVSAFSVAGAVFLILELDQPLGGLIRISSEPMANVVQHLGK
jgi:FtsH-binding integral membrane protein